MGNRNIPKIIFKARTRFIKKKYFNILFCDRNFRLIGRLGFLELNKTKPFVHNTLLLSRKLIIESLLNIINIRARLIFKYFFLHSAYRFFLKKNGLGQLFSKIMLTKRKYGYELF